MSIMEVFHSQQGQCCKEQILKFFHAYRIVLVRVQVDEFGSYQLSGTPSDWSRAVTWLVPRPRPRPRPRPPAYRLRVQGSMSIFR